MILLSSVLIQFIDQPKIFSNIITKYINDKSVDLSAPLSHTIEYAIDKGFLDSFINGLDLTKNKLYLLVISLHEINQKYYKLLKSILPSVDELKNQFPEYAEKITSIYNE